MRDTIYRQAALKAAGKGDARVVDCVASTDAMDSYGECVEQKWMLDRYTANPVVLFAHDSRQLPIGKASNVRMEGGALHATLEFVGDDVNPKAGEVWRSIQAGVLRAVSVGFDPHSTRWEKREDREVLVLSDNELMEISVCAVPANPDALMRLRTRAAGATTRNDMDKDEDQLVAAALAVTGEKTAKDAAPVLRAIATNAKRAEALEAENAKLREELDTQRKAAEATARKALIDQGVREGRITPADLADEEWQKDIAAMTLDGLSRHIKRLRSVVPVAVQPVEKKLDSSDPVAGGGAVTLTAEDREVCRKTGTDPKVFLAHKQKLADEARAKSAEGTA